MKDIIDRAIANRKAKFEAVGYELRESSSAKEFVRCAECVNFIVLQIKFLLWLKKVLP